MKPKNGLVVSFLLLEIICLNVESKCLKGCHLALASYYVLEDFTLGNITLFMQSDVVSDSEVIASYNKGRVLHRNDVLSFTRLNIPFPCDCINGDFLGHVFDYSIAAGDTYDLIATKNYALLTTVELLERFNNYSDPNHLPLNGKLNVTVNCYCGNSQISKDYGLFITYPLRPSDNLQSIANETSIDAKLLQSYNPGVNFSDRHGLVFIPGKDQNGDYVPLDSRTGGLGGGVIAGISIGGISVLLLLAVYINVRYCQKKAEEVSSLLEESIELSAQDSSRSAGPAARLTGIMVGTSVEFSYQEIAKATDNFSLNYKIGQGGFGAVYYAVLRGERTAIKKMDIEASEEFLVELKVLTCVRHLNLVRLIGYCVEGSLFLVYEYIDNGNLSHYLRASGRDPLPWSTRVQIALDSARALEYIHEHVVPVYIHRDIKSANILIDQSFHGKVADFGLAKLSEVGSSSRFTSRVAGTVGYMPPEYVECGDVSPKIDVFAFGVVLYELISAKEAIVRTTEPVAESKHLVALFEEVLSQPDPMEDLRKLVDPMLGDNYPIDSVRKMAQIAKGCTEDNPLLRPSMRSVVVALTILSNTTEEWDAGPSLENQTRMKLISGR